MRWRQRLSRVTASGAFIPEVDGLRCVAIGAVIVHHVTASYLTTTGRLGPVDLPAHWWDLFSKSTAVVVGYSGYFGVNLFFAISGFILALPFVRSYRQGSRRPHLGAYYLRRVVRLEAPYMISLTVAFALIVLTNPGWRAFVPHLLASLLYLHGPVFGQPSWVNGVAWSLEVEVQFYLVMPLLATLFAVRPAALRRGLIVAGILGGAWLAAVVSRGNLHPRLQLSLCNYLQFFLAGFLLADLYQAHGAAPFRRLWRWDAIAALSGAGIFVIITRRYDLFGLTPFLVASLCAGLFLGRIGHGVVSRRAVVVTGGMCYTIYLYHFMVIDALAPTTMRLARASHPIAVDLVLQCGLLAAPILVVSAVLFLLIEQPFMTLSRAVSRRVQTAAAASGQAPAVGRAAVEP